MNKLQEELLAKATSEKNVEDDWQSIMTLSDELLRATEKQAAAFVQSIVKKLKSGQPRVQRQAIIVVHACFQNSGGTIRLAVCSAAFMSEVKRLLTDSTHSQVKEELIKSLAAWKKSFGSQYEFNLLVRTMAELENMGVRFSQSSESKPLSTKIDPSEEEAIMKAIAASLDDASSNTTKTSSTTFSAVKTKASPQRVKVLYDFEAADDQELQLHAGDIIFVIDKTDPQWWLGQDSTGDEGYFPASFVSVNLQAKTDREEKAAAAAAAAAAAEAQSQQKEPEVQGNGDLTLEQAENIFSGLSSCIANAWQSNSASEFVRDSEEQISAGRAAVNNLLEQIQEMDADIAEFESLLSQHERFDSFYQHRIQQAQAEMQAAPQSMGHHNGHGMGMGMQQHRYPGNGEPQAHQPRQPGGYGEAPYPYPAHAQQGPGGYGGQPNGYSDATQADAYGGPQNQHQQAYQPEQGQQMEYQSEQHDQRYAPQSGQQDYQQQQQQQYTPSVSQQQEYQPQQQQPQDYQRPDQSYHQPQQDMRQQHDYQQQQHPPQQDYAQQPPQDYRQQDYAPPQHQQQQDYAPPHAPPQHQPQQQDYAPPPQHHQDYAPPQHQQQQGYARGAPQQYMGPGQASDPYAMSAQPLQPSPYVMQ